MRTSLNVERLIYWLRFGWWFDVRVLRKWYYKDEKGYKIYDIMDMVTEGDTEITEELISLRSSKIRGERC